MRMFLKNSDVQLYLTTNCCFIDPLDVKPISFQSLHKYSGNISRKKCHRQDHKANEIFL